MNALLPPTPEAVLRSLASVRSEAAPVCSRRSHGGPRMNALLPPTPESVLRSLASVRAKATPQSAPDVRVEAGV